MAQELHRLVVVRKASFTATFRNENRHSAPYAMRNPFEIIGSLGLPPVTGVLQVGANSGQEVPLFLANGVQKAILIEPLDGPFLALKQRCAGLSGYALAQALCGPKDDEEVDFHVASNNGESSSILKPTRHLQDHAWVTFPQVLRLKTVTLDAVVTAVASYRPEIARSTNLLYMDVQGAELKVLLGAAHVLKVVSHIYTEVGVGGSYEDDVELIDLLKFLRPHNFKLYDLQSEHFGFGNALLVKRVDR
jgi:FkbM family methyltransferase